MGIRAAGFARGSFAELNGERFKIATELGQPDQVPVVFATMAWWNSGYVGVKHMYDYYMNPKIMLEAQKAVSERFRGLTGYWPDFGGSG